MDRKEKYPVVGRRRPRGDDELRAAAKRHLLFYGRDFSDVIITRAAGAYTRAMALTLTADGVALLAKVHAVAAEASRLAHELMITVERQCMGPFADGRAA